MSRIQSVKQNYQPKTSNFRQNGQKIAQNPNFTSASSVEKELMKGVESKIDESMKHGRVRKVVNYFSRLFDKNDGEIQTQVINAVFTTTLAPLFIAFNPFSTQDKKTKEYTALRQPISAAIAISGGYALTSLTNSWIEKMGSEGDFGKFIDLRLKPDKTYLKTQFKKEFNANQDKKAFLEKYKPANFEGTAFDTSGNPTRKYKKACCEEYIKSVHSERKNLFAKLMGADPGENNSNFKVNDKGEIFLKGEKIGENIPNMKTQAELETYIKENNVHNIEFNKLLQDEFKFEFYDGGKIKPYSLEKSLKDVRAMDVLEKLGMKGFTEAELNSALDKIRLDKAVKKLEKAEAALSPKDRRSMEELLKAAKRMVEGQLGEEAESSKRLSIGQLFHKLDYIDDEGVKGLKDLQVLMNKNISAVIDELSKKLENLSVSDNKTKGGKAFFTEKAKEAFLTNMTEHKIDKTASYFKNFKGYTGIGFNVVIVAITCTILNWVYPRIVKQLFPTLLVEDAPKGGNK